MTITKLSDQNQLVETSKFPYCKFPFEYFNPVQSRFFEVFSEDANIIVASPTASGKTTIAEMAISHEIYSRGGKGMYLGPMKALSQEKIDDWTDDNHSFNKLKLSICTGDHRLTHDRRDELSDSNIVLMTTEMLNSASRHFKSAKNNFLTEIGTLVSDECFPAATKIRVEDNIDLKIKKIIEDEKITHVQSFDENTGQIVKKKILNKITKTYQYDLVSVEHEIGKFTCTFSHKIWTENRGYVPAGELTSDDILKWIPLKESNNCPICNKECTALELHYLYKHIHPGENAFHVKSEKKCEKCGNMISIYGHASHEKSCDGSGKPIKKAYVPKSVICSICGKEFKSALSRATHEKHHFLTQEYYNEQGKKLAENPKYIESMRQMGLQRKGANNPIFNTPDGIEKLKKTASNRWKSLSAEERQQQIERFINAPKNKTHGTSLELWLEDVVKNMFPISRVSGGKKWIKFKNGKWKNPDFQVDNQPLKIIEIGDTEFWHTQEEIANVIESYKEVGYQCLYLTDKDVKKGKEYVLSILEKFLNNHSSKVISVNRYGNGCTKYVYDLEIEDTHNYFANGVLVSNCHLIGAPIRGPVCEVGTMKMAQLNPNCRFVILSATLPNVDEIGTWLSKLTNRKTYVIESNYRPCKLNIHYETYDDERWMPYDEKEKNKVNSAIKFIKKFPDDKFLIFAHTKKIGDMMCEALRKIKIDTDFHNANLTKDKRLSLGKKFNEDKNFRTLIATSTMAWGVNTAARRVIILGPYRGLELVEDYDIWQMAGRAGRPRYDTEGDVYILLPKSKEKELKKHYLNCKPIRSQLVDEDGRDYKTLAFHIINEIHYEEVKNEDDVHKWFSRSFAAHQNKSLDDDLVHKLLEALKNCSAIAEDEEGNLSVLSVGKIASLFYYSPFDVADLKKNFTMLFEEGKEKNDVWLSLALGNLDSNRLGIITNAEKDQLDVFKNKITYDMRKKFGNLTDHAMKISYVYYLIINGLSNSVLSAITRGIQMDSQRLLEVIRAVNSYFSLKQDKYLSDLSSRMLYGIEWDILDLVKLDGIGKVKANKLAQAKLKNLKDVAQKPHIVRLALECSEAQAEKISNNARLLLMEKENYAKI